MPKNWKDWFIVATLGVIVLAGIRSLIDIATPRYPTPEMRAADEKLKRSMQELKESYEALEKDRQSQPRDY